MNKEDLEKTRALNELSEQIKNKEQELYVDIPDDINENVKENKEELYNNLVSDDTKVFNENELNTIKEEKNKKDNIFKKLKDKFNKLSKKQKIIVIVSSLIILIAIISLIVILINSNKKEEVSEEESIIIAKDNYVYQNGFLTMLDENDNSLGTYECENKDENKCYVAYLDNDEDPFLTPIQKYEDDTLIKTRSKIYNERYVFIFDNDDISSKLIKLYDMQDNKVLDEYYGIKAYDVENVNTVVLKDKDNNYGLFEFKTNELSTLIDFKYQFMGLIDKDNDNLIVVKNNKGYFLIDYNDNTKTRVFSNEIVDYNDEYILIKTSNNKYSVFNYSGDDYLKDFDFIKFIDNNLAAVVKDNELFIRGYSNNKYNEEGFELTNDNYVKTYIFDENNSLVSTLYAFDLELHDKTLTLKIMNSDKTTRNETLDLKEGEISLKYKYYSYFNGILYFYNDEEKTNIIGTYECKNSNNTSNSTFNNCYVAKTTFFSDNYLTPKKDVDAYIPIYNNKYVFILDAPELQNDDNIEIKFYDLINKKVLGTYVAIDADIDNNEDMDFKDISSTKIIAKLKSGKFGVIEISGSEANVIHKFNYNYIERANDDFIVQLENNNWQVIYNNSKYSSNEFGGKILNYGNGYFVIKQNDKEFIYKADGNEILTSGYDYIDISNQEVFGVVSSNKLDIYTKDGKKLTDESINLISTNYTSSSFRITVNGNQVSVNIYKEDNTLDSTKYLQLNSIGDDDEE